jgi:site-specific DNA-methyltransferase (adenine-specific)
LIHDGSEEVVRLFPETSAGSHPACRNTSGYSGGLQQGKTPHGAVRTDSGSAARFFYTAKASRAERQGVTHPTVKPLDLMAYLCRLVTPPGGIVLDPYMGSGTTIKAAVSEGFHAVGIELDPENYAMAQHRMDGTQLGLGI